MTRSRVPTRRPARPSVYGASRVETILDDDHNDFGYSLGRHTSFNAAVTACETDALARGNRTLGRWEIHDKRTHRMSAGGMTWRVIRHA